MSVYIVVYQGLKKYEGKVDEAYGNCDEDTNLFEVDGNSECPEFLDGLEIDDVYSYRGEVWFGFGEGPALNENLEKLAGLVAYDSQMPGANEPGPFRELFRWGGVGTIGPVASAKLAADFADWDADARARCDASFYSFFATMRAMFDCVVAGACVQYRVKPRRAVVHQIQRKHVDARISPHGLHP
ncbi:hypothetical protein [Paraburkholderia phenoliruptrix]|uniref:hypothetical protein n=1 Tax=Paraburkholderia phenoliruptrix TaxID=252970 RepID=UPI002869868F|nr:hypothetical protein [Paraburkholderia phenoliruptrix]WMY10899.1 hypothetical protein P3F88_29905 [Paraburkholderia phenoliruptrix]